MWCINTVISGFMIFITIKFNSHQDQIPHPNLAKIAMQFMYKLTYPSINRFWKHFRSLSGKPSTVSTQSVSNGLQSAACQDPVISLNIGNFFLSLYLQAAAAVLRPQIFPLNCNTQVLFLNHLSIKAFIHMYCVQFIFCTQHSFWHQQYVVPLMNLSSTCFSPWNERLGFFSIVWAQIGKGG